MILDLGSFTRKGLMVDHVCPAESWERQSMERTEGEDQKGGGSIQRGHQPVCNVRVTGINTQLRPKNPVPSQIAFTIRSSFNSNRITAHLHSFVPRFSHL